MSEPTLLELLASEAESLDNRAAGMSTLDQSETTLEAAARLFSRAARLRAAAERLRRADAEQRYYDGGIYRRGWLDALERINGGPIPGEKG